MYSRKGNHITLRPYEGDYKYFLFMVYITQAKCLLLEAASHPLPPWD